MERLLLLLLLLLSTAFIPSSSFSLGRHHRLLRSSSCNNKYDDIICTQRSGVNNNIVVLHSSSSPISSSSQRTERSPWSSGKWRITLDFGIDESQQQQQRQQDPTRSIGSSSSTNNENTILLHKLLGQNWGANGGRLVLPFDVVVNSDTGSSSSNENSGGQKSVEMAWLGGKPTGGMECIPKQQQANDKNKNEDDNNNHDNNDNEIYHATYINSKGEQHVQIIPGQWRHEPPTPLLPTYTTILSGQTTLLRLYLTLHTSIERNTISFPSNQLLLLQSNTFRTTQYKNGIQTLTPYQYSMEQSQQILEEQLNHDSGDRRLDGDDLLETLGGYKDIAKLVMERDEWGRRWREVEGVLPKIVGSSSSGRRGESMEKLLNDEKRWGVWPGDTELMTVERGVILAAVTVKDKKEQRSLLFPWMQESKVQEMVVVGKWSATPLPFE